MLKHSDGVSMFCPECGTLAFPDPSGNIECRNYKCGYKGSAENKIRGTDGKEINLAELVSSSIAETREYGIINDGDEMKGVRTDGQYHCPKCPSSKVYSYLEPLLDMGEIQVAMLTCIECGWGWRDH
jgi:DNA-directed RNA polymerase subunit M/transcription elongation factor TFIIS